MAAPPLGSVIFAAVWLSVFRHQEGVDLQVLDPSAFTVASYIVTTGMSALYFLPLITANSLTNCYCRGGALIIVFVAFLDQKKTQNEAMMDRSGQSVLMYQKKARNDIIHAEGGRKSANSIQNQLTLGMHNTDS